MSHLESGARFGRVTPVLLDASRDAAQIRFEALCAPLRTDVFRFVVWLSGDPVVADDVVQESFIRAWTHIGSLQDERATRSWLLSIARRELARAYARNQSVLKSSELVDGCDAQSVRGPATTLNDELHWAVMGLPDRYRDVLVLQVFLGYNTAEIAKLTGSTRNAVCTRLCRARRQLLALL